jgi:predicted small secreted protein
MNRNYLVKNILWTIIIVMMLAVVLCTSGCGTVAGFGNDISAAANWTKDQMTGNSK